MFQTILLAVVLVVVIFLGFVIRKPDSFRITRSTTIKAPPEKIAAFIEDFHRWTAWSPWEHRDPNLQRTFAGPERGRGARYAWVGNKSVGEGRMEIQEASPTRIVIDLEFIKPFAARNISEFILVPAADATTVNWVMTGPSPFMSKLMDTLMNMDKMIGKDFERGLADLKTAAES